MVTHSFLLRHGTFSALDIPGAAATFPLGMNPQGEIVGVYADSNFNFFGFLLSHGTITSIDDPNACAGCTTPYGINPQGNTIVGNYFDNSLNAHGFILKKN